MRATKLCKGLHYCSVQGQLLISVIWRELTRTRIFDAAAGLAFYFLLSMLPLLIVFASLLTYLPISDLFQQLLNMMAELVPPDSLTMVERIVASILTPHHGALSFGILGYLWSSIGAFSSLIYLLNNIYDVKQSRRWWRDRLQALLLACTSGGLVSVSLIALISGPRFGHLFGEVFPMLRDLEYLWPFLRITLTFVTFVAALELVYFLGPNIKQHFLASLPGAVFAISMWFLGSAALNFYLRHMVHYNVTYGSLGALIGLMLWCYITALAILIGAELNAELARRAKFRAQSEFREQNASVLNP
jgi:membrane protein